MIKYRVKENQSLNDESFGGSIIVGMMEGGMDQTMRNYFLC